jgi:glycosyl hydrolase family 42 (putative beta-galactosidase)
LLAISFLLALLLSLTAVSAASGRSSSNVRVTPFSAEVSFSTPVPTTARVGYGINGVITAWTPTLPFATEHTARLSGLRPNTTYRVVVSVVGPDGRRGSGETQVHTAPYPLFARAAMSGGALTLDGEPFFPILAFGQCDTFDQSLARGVNLFLLGGCHNEDEATEATAIAGQGLVATSAVSKLQVPGQIGYTYQDEADAFGATYESLPALPAWQDSGKVSFLTLTNHFYSRAEALPHGKEMYPGLAKRADILGFDLYPLQEWCRSDSFADVYQAQRDLDKLVQGRPTYQWIETRAMKCPSKTLNPTPQTVTAETWLAIAGGADGIGWFPWHPETDAIGAAMLRLGDEIAALQPALLAPEIWSGASRGKGVFVGARRLNDAIYVIAVNSTRSKVTASIGVGGLGSNAVETIFEPKRRIVPVGGIFTDSFGPLQAHVYVYAPDGYGTRSSSPGDATRTGAARTLKHTLSRADS